MSDATRPASGDGAAPTGPGAVPFALRGRLPPDEPLIWAERPHPLFILLASLGSLLALALVVGLALALASFLPGRARGFVVGVPVLGMVLILVWRTLDWFFRGYALTSVRAVRVSGVLRQTMVEVPLARVQHTILDRTLLERAFGLGTIAFATAGTGAVELVWRGIGAPARTLDTARSATDHATDQATGRGEAAPGGASARAGGRGSARIPLIGLAGGIGAGKSTVARAFEALGCVVVDSDVAAKESLDEPEIRDELVRWWGPGVVGEDGRVRRSAVADIVFRDPDQRRRLEALVHPVVHRRRAEAVERASESGRRAVIVDAPLLFEAGVDRQCDAVVFVDVPRRVRLERVRRERGWTEEELVRRESAQMPLDEKRAASDFVLQNDGAVSDLEDRVRAILEALEGPGRPRRGPSRN